MFREAFPYYLVMGMTYDEFWHGEPSLVRDYRKAWDIKQHNEEYARWRQGMYTYIALLNASPLFRPFAKGEVKPGEYPSEPLPLNDKEAQDQERRREEKNFKEYLAQMEAQSARNLKLREQQKQKEVVEDG